MQPHQWFAHGKNKLRDIIAPINAANRYPTRTTSGHYPIPEPWGNLPRTVLQQQMASDNRYNLDWQHEYLQRPAFSPGAGYAAYTSFGLYEQTAIGAGVANRRQFRSVETASIMPLKSIMASGIPHDAGLVALQSLTIDNPDLQGYIG
jgi:hypothetical protein